MTDIIAERVLEFRDGETTVPVTVRLYRPEKQPTGEWGCTLEILGLRAAHKRPIFGADAVEALYLALRAAKMEIDLWDGLTWRNGAPWVDVPGVPE
jgi:hypothetical protein